MELLEVLLRTLQTQKNDIKQLALHKDVLYTYHTSVFTSG
jgi:hypothetical protein